MTVFNSKRRRSPMLALALVGGSAQAFAPSIRAPVSRIQKGFKRKAPTHMNMPLEDSPFMAATLDELDMSAPDEYDNLFSDTSGSYEQSTDFTGASLTHDDIAKEMVLEAMEDPATIATLENVDAVLSVSQHAVEEAEASLPKEVSDSIPLIPPPSNNTLGNTQAPLDIVEASTVIGTKIETPSVGKILRFAIPAVGVWLCGPLLSLIDTSAVGLLSGTAQQAALNPATAVTDYAALLIAFMYTGTTNLVAAAQESDHGDEDKPKASRAMITAIQLSGYVGAALGAALFIFARQLLSAIIGNDGISPEVFGAAMKYVRIRALGMPAAAVIGSAQAGCLGLQDIRSPLYVLGAAAFVNFIGDMLFVRSPHWLFGGAAGAAWATVFSQYAAVACFVRWLSKRPKGPKKVVNLTDAIMELTGDDESKGGTRRRNFRDSAASFKPLSTKTGKGFVKRLSSITKRFTRQKKSEEAAVRPPPKKREKSFSTRGLLEGKMTPIDMVKFPDPKHAKEFAPYVVPVTATQVGRVSGYVAMSHVVSSSLGTISMAAQQVIVALFYCLCPIADSLNLTAQSFLPVIAGKPKSKERAAALRKAGENFFKAGGLFGAVMSGAVLTIPFLSRFFTADPAVCTLVNMVTPLLLGIFAVHGVLCSSEGLILGQKDLSFLGKMYCSFFVVVPLMMLRVKKAALAGHPVNLTDVWKVFLSYQLFRFAAFAGRVFQLQRRTDRHAAALDDVSI